MIDQTSYNIGYQRGTLDEHARRESESDDYDFIYSIGYQDGLVAGANRVEQVMDVLLRNRYGDVTDQEALEAISAAVGYFPAKR